MHSRYKLTLTPGGAPLGRRAPQSNTCLSTINLGDTTCGLISYVALSTGVACNLSTVCQSTYFV